MKKLITITFILSLFITFNSFATTDTTLSLKIPQKIDSKICRKKIFNNIDVTWLGVKDMRKEKTIATMEKSNGEIQTYSTALPLSTYFDQTFQSVLRACGLNIVPKQQNHGYKVSAKIREFSAKLDKNLIKSEISAKSEVVLLFKNNFATVDVGIGYIIESKGPNFKNKKKMQKMMSELFVGTIKEIIASDQINFLKP